MFIKDCISKVWSSLAWSIRYTPYTNSVHTLYVFQSYRLTTYQNLLLCKRSIINFLMNPSIISYFYFSFNGIHCVNSFTYLFSLVFFVLLTLKSFEILPNNNRYDFILESFPLNCYIFIILMNKNLLLPLQCRFQQNVLHNSVKVIQYSAPTGDVVSLSLCIRP